MRFSTLPVLEHPLIELRPLTEGDMADWAAYLNLPAVYEHTSWNAPSATDLLVHEGSHRSGEWDAPMRLAIALRESGELVGTVGFHSVSSHNRSLELAFDLRPSHWGLGFASAAARAVVQWAHHTAGFIRVQATALPSNHRSIRTLERLGFEREGLLRAYRMVRGVPGDFDVYSRVFDLEITEGSRP